MTSAGRRNTPAQDFLGSLAFLALGAALVRWSGDTCVSSANDRQFEGGALLNDGSDGLFTHQGIQ
ncbi:hypothetical protein ACFWAR_04345 [Streptomyces sp. NPDC059917]|uniref:hypothetical protein n=1 Tax=Streptomyces sp. NPDC059917 TaxID=3347002 RepID=UPI003647841F